ncbi:MAG: M28 family peptidase [Treponema sp.]
MYNSAVVERVLSSGFSNSSVFKSFLQQGIDRRDFIISFLKEHGVPFMPVSLSTGKHIIVHYSKKNYNKCYKNKLLIAHYDRKENTEGANDNSAASFILMNFAVYLLSCNYEHNIKIIFTDSEEVASAGLELQGSYKLALGLRKLNMTDSDVYIFDMCGRGEVLIFSLAGIYGRPKEKTASLQDLHNKAISHARESASKHMSLITPYSDNAGFIAAGLNAQLVTVLPLDEATILKKGLDDLQEKPSYSELIDIILKNKRIEKDSPLEKIIPLTWQKMHTPFDTIDTLTDSSFALVYNYMKVLARKMERY